MKKLGGMVLFPYKLNGDWVFDDDRVGLCQDPFVAGMPAIIDFLVADAKIKNPDDGFKLRPPRLATATVQPINTN